MSAGAPRAKRALLIGIDAYPRLTPLKGCVNDSLLMRSVLEENFGFPASAVTQLANEQATRVGILDALDHLVESTGPDDIVVIHYAGHGSLMRDREGDEPSGFDSTIMPVDSEGGQGDNRDITDDEIHLRLQRLGEKTRYTTLIFDCCHSGTITRDSFGERARSMPPDRRPISELPPSPIPPELRAAARGSGPSGWMPLTGKYVLIAGCRDEERSYECTPQEGGGTVTQGAMTYFLCQELRRALPGSSYRDVFERMAVQVNANNAGQHPQMEGSADREIFGVADLEPMKFVRVTARNGERITLAAGAAHGMTVGSTWKVYPHGTRSTDAAEVLGEVEITSVRAVTADARVLSESAAIGVNARAIEDVHAWGDLRLRVQLSAAAGHEPAQSALQDGLNASALLQVVAETEPAAACVYVMAPRAAVAASDPVPQLGPLEVATLAVVREDGELMMPAKQLHEHRAVIANLEKLARYRQALALENPDTNSKLRGKFTLVLLRWTGGKWEDAEPESAGGHVVYRDGDHIAFRISSQHTEPAFISLLDFGLSGAVSPIYPAAGAKEQLQPGGSFEVGTDEELPLGFPDVFPFVGDRLHDAPVEGIEVAKLFVTTSEADFGFLEQEGVRSARTARESPLMQLWRTAASGAATRDIVKVPLGNEDWTTIVKPFVLRR